MKLKKIITEFASLLGWIVIVFILQDVVLVFGYSITNDITTNLTALLLIIGLGIWGTYMFNKYFLNKNILKKLEELPKVYNEKSLDVLNDFLDNMKNNCYVSGVTLNTYASGIPDKLVELIRNGKHFTFLLPHPDSKFLKEQDALTVSLNSRGELIPQLERFSELFQKLKGNEVERIKIKFHHLPLIYSMLIVDPELEEGKMDISLYDFNKDSTYRTGITIIRKHSKRLFDKHYKSLKIMLDHELTDDWDFQQFISSEDTHSK